MSALHDFIARENDIDGLRELLKMGENPNSQDRSGRTPLHLAVLKSERYPQEADDLLLVVRELIYYGANVDEGNNLGKTPLHYAVGCRNCNMIETLLLSGAQINQKDNAGYAAIHFATSRRTFRGNISYDLDLGVVKLLLRYNPEIDLRGGLGETALMLAVNHNNFYIVRELLKNKASGSLQDSNGDSAMHYALKRPEVNVDIVLELARHGCSFKMINHSDFSPMTLYFWGLMSGPPSKVEKAKFVFKLFLIYGNKFNFFQKKYIKKLNENKDSKLSDFLACCDSEINQMRADALDSNVNVYDIALRGALYCDAENTSHIPHEVFDKVLDKLIKREYPVYCDLIAAGICSPYMNEKFVELCCSVEMGNGILNYDALYLLSFYLSHFDMLNMMIACSGGWKRFWYLPRFTYNTRCSVS